MKPRPFLWLAVLLTFIVAFSNIALAMQVTDPDAPLHPESMARYFPANTDMLVSVRIDESFVDQLDQFVMLVTGAFESYDVPTVSMRDALRMSGFDLDTVLPAFGNYAAIGISSIEGVMTGSQPDYTYVLEVEDEGAARAFFAMVGFGEDGDALTNDQGITIQFFDGVMLLSEGDESLPDGETLADSADFQTVIDTLPADGYNAIGYVSDAIFAAIPAGMGAIEQDILGDSNDFAIGLTVLDGVTYTIDTAQLPPEDSASAAVTPINPAFTRFIPADADLFVQSRNLSGLLDSGLDVVDLVARPVTGNLYMDGTAVPITPQPTPSVREQVEAGLGLLGIDLEDDILSWTTSDFAFFGRADVRQIAASAIQQQSAGAAIQDRYDFGMIIEATDPAKAQELADSLDRLINTFAGNLPEVEIANESINGVDVTSVTIFAVLTTYPEIDKTPIQFMLGASDDLFFFGTRGAITGALEGGESLADSTAYVDAQRYILPNPVTLAYTNDEGFIVGLFANPTAVVYLALLGPSIGNIFDNIIADLNSGIILTPTPTPSPTPSPTPDVDALLSPLDYLTSHIRHSTISSTITTEGVTLIRITATLK